MTVTRDADYNKGGVKFKISIEEKCIKIPKECTEVSVVGTYEHKYWLEFSLLPKGHFTEVDIICHPVKATATTLLMRVCYGCKGTKVPLMGTLKLPWSPNSELFVSLVFPHNKSYQWEGYEKYTVFAK